MSELSVTVILLIAVGAVAALACAVWCVCDFRRRAAAEPADSAAASSSTREASDQYASIGLVRCCLATEIRAQKRAVQYANLPVDPKTGERSQRSDASQVRRSIAIATQMICLATT